MLMEMQSTKTHEKKKEEKGKGDGSLFPFLGKRDTFNLI